MPEGSPAQSQKVAVIAVHGVAYHAPGASARAVCDLVAGLSPQQIGAKYGPFHENTIHIPLKPLNVPHLTRAAPEGAVDWFRARVWERTVFLTRSWRKDDKTDDQDLETRGAPGGAVSAPAANPSATSKTSPPRHEPRDKVANDFMRLLLEDYRGTKGNKPKDERDATTYVTTRLDGERVRNCVDAPSDASTVHFYEMYWADLSRPNQSVLAFFQALYQLILHVASLSRISISTAYENRNDGLWRALDWSHGWAVRMLTLPIPILNVLLLVSLMGAVPHLIWDNWVAGIAIFASGVMGLLIFLFVEPELSPTRNPGTYILLPLIFVAAFAGFGGVYCHLHPAPDDMRRLLALEGLLLGFGLVWLSAKSYEEVRNGAVWTAMSLGFVWIVLFLGMFWRRPDAPVEQITLWVMQILLAGLRLSWALLIGFALLAFLFGWMSVLNLKSRGASAGRSNRAARAEAAVRTSRLALALPMLALWIVTLALFSGLFVKTAGNEKSEKSIANRLFSSNSYHEIEDPISPADYKPWDRVLRPLFLDREDSRQFARELANERHMTPNQYFRAVLVWGATPSFPIILVLLGYGLLLLAFWVIPSIWTEMSPPRASNNARSEHMGSWLSRGLDASKISTLIMWAAAFVVPTLVTLGWPFAGLFKRIDGQILDGLNAWTARIVLYIGGVAGSLAILASLVKSGSSVLGIVLDVDNYLRTAPKDATPRARIIERYVSLLDYVSEYRDPADGRGYDRVVIVAHSLGALISCDLLRDPYAHARRSNIPIYLFTMGNPLRQLLNRFFPYLYEWARELPDNSKETLPADLEKKPAIASTDLPNPCDLGVGRWLNAYRSGDYVGRSLWLTEWYDRTCTSSNASTTPACVVAEAGGQRAEMCIGAGAHQHYWDESAPDIALQLDNLIST